MSETKSHIASTDRSTMDKAGVAATAESRAVRDEYRAIMGIDPEKATPTMYDRVEKDYRWHRAQYWFVASLANGLLLLQIILGAALTAVSASSAPGTKTAGIYLGATSTITAGLITYFKSRSQPNRSRQFYMALRNVRNKMDEAFSDLPYSSDPAAAWVKYCEIQRLYEDVLKDAEANYPDLWVTTSDMKKFLFRTGLSKDSTNSSARMNGDTSVHAISRQNPDDIVLGGAQTVR